MVNGWTAALNASAGITCCQMRGHVLAVVMTEERRHPCHELGEAVLGNLTRHETHRFGLVGRRNALLDEAVDVAVFLGQVQI